ncbi:unnamed protein product [Paramecium pentaurelia]|uniref:Cyclic nucleotide-binding domain-containing protein n=1 Tax=Paramecium pentaurelia TaxID=43138 RepID=A0A8S1X527_9CILI|nr:unnamed protein product [Paramecium pentaurelia]
MQIITNYDSEPFQLINTKRQIFGRDSDIKMRQYFERSPSIEGMDEMIDDQDKSAKPSLFSLSKANSNYKPPTINIQNIITDQRETYIFENLNQDQKEPGFNPVWKHGSLKIIRLVARFLYQLKTKAETLKLKLMNHHIFKYIDDKASDFNEFKSEKTIDDHSFKNIMCRNLKKMEGAFSVIKAILEYLFNRIGVIYPESTFKIIWDSIVVCFIVINIFFIPMSLSFELDKSSTLVWLFFETIPSYIFIAEILLNFNTAYYGHGVIHSTRKEIFHHYVSENFWWDLMISIPYVLSQLDIPYIQFVLLLRITRVKSMVQNVEDLLNAKESVQAVVELSKLIYFIIFVAHMCSCAWHLLGKIEVDVYGDNNSWLIHYGYYDKPWQTRYIVSIYWSVITTLTVGYGDIVPQTSIEQLFVVIIAMIICGVFGYSISTIGEILKNLEEKKGQFKQLMKEVNSYIKEKELNLQLSLKVRKYFEFYYQTQQSQKRSYQTLINNLNEQLKQEIMIDLYKKILIQSKFINDTFNEILINQLCQKVQQENFGPGDEIIDIKNKSEKKLIFVLNGQVDSYFHIQRTQKETLHSITQGKFSRTYKKGDIIGEFEFITNNDYSVQYRAFKFTQVAFINRQDLLEIITKDKEHLYKFQTLIDSLTYSQKLGRTCEICKWTHLYQNCPFTFYQPNIWKIVRQASASVNIKRLSFERKSRQRYKAISNSQMTIATILDFMILHNFIQEDLLCSKTLKRLGFKNNHRISQREIHEISSESSKTSSSNESQSLVIDNHKNVQMKNKRTSLQSQNDKNDNKFDRLRTTLNMKDSNKNNLIKPILQKMNSFGQQSLEDTNNQNSIPNIKLFPQFYKKKSSIQNIKPMLKLETQVNEVDTNKDTLKLYSNQKIPENFDDMDLMMQENNNFYPEFNIFKVIETYNKCRIRNLSFRKKRLFHEKLKSIRLQKQFNLKILTPRSSQQII